MKGHNLMQAIARVNRVFKDKPGGLVVDYIGIATELKQALLEYSPNLTSGYNQGGKGKSLIGWNIWSDKSIFSVGKTSKKRFVLWKKRVLSPNKAVIFLNYSSEDKQATTGLLKQLLTEQRQPLRT